MKPTTRAAIQGIIDDELRHCSVNERAFFDTHKVAFKETPIIRGAGVESVYVVAEVGQHVIYYDDVKGGFEESVLDPAGRIAATGCNEYTLSMLLHKMLSQSGQLWVEGTRCLNQSEAERLKNEIEALLDDDRKRGLKPFASLDAYEWKPGGYRVSYRNANEGLWWELTGAAPALAAEAVRRWDFASYRRLRPAFDALLAVGHSLSEVAWVEPQLDAIELLAPPYGGIRIGEIEQARFSLVWHRNAGRDVTDLSDLSIEDAVQKVFGDEGITAYRESWIYSGSDEEE